jgi:hypothetical protein
LNQKNCENFPQEESQMSFGIGNYEAVVRAHLPRKTEKLCKTRQGITTIPEEKTSHHTTARARTGFFILEAAFALERSLPTCAVRLVDALSVWISHPQIVMRECAIVVTRFRSLQCGTVIKNMKWTLSLSGYHGGYHRREIDPHQV